MSQVVWCKYVFVLLPVIVNYKYIFKNSIDIDRHKRALIMSIPLPVALNAHEVEEFGKELDEIYEETISSLGSQDEKYIKRLISIQRSMAFVSRLIIFSALAFLPNWWEHSLASWLAFYSIAGFGVLLLASAKILENMEISHNILHGQWDWMRDPEINSTVWEWDHASPADQWKIPTMSYTIHGLTYCTKIMMLAMGLCELALSKSGGLVICCNLYTISFSVFSSNGALVYRR